jgi:hypothetical protein
MASLITTDQIQYWMKLDGVFVRVTENNAFDPSTDLETYDPKYKDRVNQPSYVTGKKTSIEMDIDLIDPGELQSWLIAHEDEVNVEVDIVRVFSFRPAVPDWAATTAHTVGQRVIGSTNIYECTVAGTTGSSEPTWPSSGTVTDGTATWTYVGSAEGHPVGASGYAAKKATFTLTQNPIDGPAGEAAKATGTLNMKSDGWTEGLFDTGTKTFTPAG